MKAARWPGREDAAPALFTGDKVRQMKVIVLEIDGHFIGLTVERAERLQSALTDALWCAETSQPGERTEITLADGSKVTLTHSEDAAKGE